MSIELDLMSDDLRAADLDRFVRDINVALARTGAETELATHPTQTGDRGAATVLGKILLDVVKTSAAGEIIKVLAAYLGRDKSVVGKITFPDGTIVEVNATNLRSGEFTTTLETMVAKASGA